MTTAGQADRFELITPGYRLRAHGIARVVEADAWNGPAVAEAVRAALASAREKGKRAIVAGVIPFDPARPALLRIPEAHEWDAGTDVAPARESSPGGTISTPRGSDHPGYRNAVARAVRDIRSSARREGGLRKVVLARELLVRAGHPIDADALRERLAARNPAACTFRMDLPREHAGGSGEHGGAVLIGASPELVLRSAGGRVESHPLAGSAPRHEDPAEDEAAGRALLASAKDLEEHAHVVDAVGAAFREHAEEVEIPAAPGLLSTPVIHHLGTRITGRLRPGRSPIELAYAMHPTPAVLGMPPAAAAELIGRLEDFDRGLYAGLIGWQDAEGDGEWFLVLRCGIIRGHEATLYAGAGIVAGSDPELEHRETAVKLSTLASALGAGLENAPHCADSSSSQRVTR